MQLMTKRTLVLLLGIFATIALIGCTDKTTTTTGPFSGEIPEISNPDEIFYTNGTYSITYGDIYEEFKINDGINRLLFMIDEELLANYLSAVTAEEISSKIKYMTYGTTDDNEIAKISDEDKLKYEHNYDENMSMLGYGDNEEVYVRMVCAKDNYAAYAMTLAANADKAWYNGPKTIASYYDSTYYPDLSSIKIRFYSETDAKSVLKLFNLVSISGALKLYTGTKPIDEVPSTAFNDTNTVVLSNEEIITYFIEMYNYVYGAYKTQIPMDATVEELIANEDLKINYLDAFDASSTLSKFLFVTLGSYNAYLEDSTTTLYYTYTPVKYYGTNDTSYYMVLNLDRTEKADVSDFDGNEADLVALTTREVYDDISSTIKENYLTSQGFVAERISKLRKDSNLVIYDYYLGIDYKAIDDTFESDEDGSATLVASVSGKDISADELFSHSLNLNPGIYTLYATQLGISMNDYFSRVYCPVDSTVCEFDISKNDSPKIREHFDTLAQLKTSFEASYYVYYYTFEEYMYLAYGAKTTNDMILKYYIKSTLQPYMVYEELQKDNWDLVSGYLFDLVQEYYDNYFSLNAKHILLFVDRNEDGNPDDYDDFLAGLEDRPAYDSLLADFEATIRTYLEETNHDFDTLVSDFAKAKRTSTTWGRFKNYGFYIMTENLSTAGSLTYMSSVNTYEQPFVDGLIATYQQYVLAANKDRLFIYYDGNVQTSYGIHLIRAAKGTDFTKPSAKFNMTYNTSGDPNYTLGIENTSDMVTVDQMKLYLEYRFDQIVYGTDATAEETYNFTLPKIPTSVMNAMDSYFKDLHDSMYVIGFINVIVSEKLQAGTFVNEVPAYCDWTDAQIKVRLAEIKEIYFNQLFDNTNN